MSRAATLAMWFWIAVLAVVVFVAVAILHPFRGSGGNDGGGGSDYVRIENDPAQDSYDNGYATAQQLLSSGGGSSAVDVCIAVYISGDIDAYEQGCRDGGR